MFDRILTKLNPAWLMLLVSGFVLLSIWFGDSYRVLAAARSNLHAAHTHNQELESNVERMKKKIRELKSDERALEREARNQLLLAKEDELIFLFETEKKEK